MSSTKREASPLAATDSASHETPSKRARLDDNSTPTVASSAAAAPAAASAPTTAAPSTPGPAAAADKELKLDAGNTADARATDSPSAGKGKRGGRGGGGGGGRGGGKQDRRGSGRGGGRGGAGRGGGGRGRDGGAGDEDKGDGEGGADGDDKKDKLPKRKVAVLLGYNGIGYKGSQVCVDVLLLSLPTRPDLMHMS